jgi:hypothetical protein
MIACLVACTFRSRKGQRLLPSLGADAAALAECSLVNSLLCRVCVLHNLCFATGLPGHDLKFCKACGLSGFRFFCGRCEEVQTRANVSGVLLWTSANFVNRSSDW